MRILVVIAAAIGLYLYVGYAHMYNDRAPLAVLNPTTQRTVELTQGTPGLVGPNIIYTALGDSLTAGTGAELATQTYPYGVSQSLAVRKKRSVTLHNLAVPGATAETVLRDQVPLVASSTITTLAIGVNDLHNHVPLATFHANVNAIVQRLKQTQARVYLVNIPYLGDRSLVWPPYRAYLQWQTNRYNGILTAVAIEHKVPLIDSYGATQAAALTGGEYYAADGFHPSANGYLLWVQTIYDTLSS